MAIAIFGVIKYNHLDCFVFINYFYLLWRLE